MKPVEGRTLVRLFNSDADFLFQHETSMFLLSLVKSTGRGTHLAGVVVKQPRVDCASASILCSYLSLSLSFLCFRRIRGQSLGNARTRKCQSAWEAWYRNTLCYRFSRRPTSLQRRTKPIARLNSPILSASGTRDPVLWHSLDQLTPFAWPPSTSSLMEPQNLAFASNEVSSLFSLSLDCLRLILRTLSPNTLGLLWFTGNMRLQAQLTHGVTHFELENSFYWPRLVEKFRLHTASIQLAHGTSCFMTGVDYGLLPSQLQVLRLQFPNALCCLYQLPRGLTLSFYFPTLKELTFSRQYCPKFSNQEFVESLPSSLLSLGLPQNICFSVDDLLHLPCQLTSLTATIQPILDGDEERFRTAKCLSSLTRLSLDMDHRAHWELFAPPSVLDYAWGMYSLKEPRRNCVLQEEHSSWIRFKSRTVALAHLPPHLTRLCLDGYASLTTEFLKGLPSTLTDLTTRDPLGTTLEQFINDLPPQITKLHTSGNPNSTKKSCDWALALPRWLANWPDCCLDREPAKKPETGPLPFRHITVCALAEHHLDILPYHLESLYASTVSSILTSGGIRRLVSNFVQLKVLDIQFASAVDLQDLRPLPPLITRLGLVLVTRNEAKISDWSTFWPPRLTSLNCGLRRSDALPVALTDLQGAQFWSSFPSSLRKLSLTMPSVAAFPSDFSSLPRRLSSLYIQQHSDASVVHITNAHFESLPRSLQSFSLRHEASYSATPEVLAALPRLLNWLHLCSPYTQRTLDPFGFGDMSWEDMWRALDKAPRFVVFAGFPQGKTDYLRAQLNRLLDNLIEACPNATFDDFDAGAHRPNRTPPRSE